MMKKEKKSTVTTSSISSKGKSIETIPTTKSDPEAIAVSEVSSPVPDFEKFSAGQEQPQKRKYTKRKTVSSVEEIPDFPLAFAHEGNKFVISLSRMLSRKDIKPSIEEMENLDGQLLILLNKYKKWLQFLFEFSYPVTLAVIIARSPSMTPTKKTDAEGASEKK